MRPRDEQVNVKKSSQPALEPAGRQVEPMPGVGQQPPYYVPQQAPMPPPVRRPDETLALVSMILGVSSFVFGFLILCSIPAVVVGHMAIRRIREDPEQYGGDGMAKAGLIIGYVNIAFCGLLVLIPVLVLLVMLFMAMIGIGVASM